MSLLLELLGKTSQLRVLDFFIENDIFDYSMADVCREIGMSRVTIRKIFDELARNGLIKKTRKVGRAQLYILNKENEVVQKLLELDQRICYQYASELEEEAKKKAMAISRCG
ncbi:MAG: hypothetical protein J7K68_01965 [Candidatus Diapherotrites archaeon]|nr:hypothetical protein [Candidatus Diapherotrites archaeon]